MTSAATSLDGRLWVMWEGEFNGHGITAFTRSNKAVTRFEPIQTSRVHLGRPVHPLRGRSSGSARPPDGGKPRPKRTLVQGIYYARLLPELSTTMTTTSLGKGKFKLNAKVTDAGDTVSGAQVSAKGQTKTTNTQGSAKLTVAGIRRRSHQGDRHPSRLSELPGLVASSKTRIIVELGERRAGGSRPAPCELPAGRHP